jgi:hypothetical protein
MFNYKPIKTKKDQRAMNEQIETQPVTVNEILASWNQERTSEQLQGFVASKLSNIALQSEDLNLDS